MSQGADSRSSDFKLILNGVRSDAVQAVAQELTTLFPLDVPTAVNILKNAPIILVDKLTPQQARSVGTYATRLRALGAEVQVTGQPVGKLQTLRWPLLPDIAKRPGNQLICPSCGARLQVQVFMPPGEVHAAPPAAQAAAPSAAPVPAQAPAAPEGKVEEESIPRVEESAPAAPHPAVSPRPAPRVVPAPPPPPPADEAILEPVEDEPVELAEEDVILEAEPEPVAAPARPAPAAAAAPSAAPGPPVGGGGNCRAVIVGKIKGDKKQNAAELMAYYLGITREEAFNDLSKKTVVTAAKNLTPEEAEDCKNRFAEIDVRVQIKG